MAGHAGDLPSVIGLDAPDRHQGVTALGQRVGGQIFELANLVAAEGDARVAVLSLGPDLHPPAQGFAQPRQRMDGRGAEQQRDTGVLVKAHDMTMP